MRNSPLLLAAAAAAICVVVFVSYVPAGAALSSISARVQAAAVFFVESINPAQLKATYREQTLALRNGASDVPSAVGTTAQPRKIRVLLVPGHEPFSGGTEFDGIYERNIVVDIADKLAALLEANPHYDVMVARTKTGWNPILQTYFDTNATAIEAFRASQAAKMASHLADGSVLPEADQVYHVTAPSETILHLYGINKWTADNHYDITIHLHINDYAGRPRGQVGKYDGFAIYVPSEEFSNALASMQIADAIARRLSAYHATSTLPEEARGVIPDQQLIAVGSNNSADDAALLIEYGYIYEPQFLHASTRSVAEEDYAYETYLGIQDFFNDSVASTTGFALQPKDLASVTASNNEADAGVYMLQGALRSLGYYPPAGKSLTDCPVSGYAGECTREALIAYQRAQGLMRSGTVGPKTRAALMAAVSR